MISSLMARKKWILGILLPAVLLISLMVAGPVFADSDTIPTTTTTSAESTDGASESDSQDKNTPAISAEPVPDTALDESSTDNTDSTAEETSPENSNPSSDEATTETGTQEGSSSTTGTDEITDGSDTSDSGTEISDPIDTTTTGDTTDLSDTASDLADSGVVLVDGTGSEVDLASKDSEMAISSADPWWTVGTVKYAFIKTGGTCPSGTTAGLTCYESDTPISSALAYMDSNDLIPSDGYLHIDADSYTENVTVDGSAGNLSTLKGIVSSGTSSNTTITGKVTISNTTSGFTLIGMTIVGQLEMTGNIGTITLSDVTVKSSSGNGITVSNHKGSVTADQVAADGNSGWGMHIDNTAGTGSVTVTNSEFNQNGSDNFGGLYINSTGVVTLDGVAASNNTGNGVEIDSAKSVTISNSTFNKNTIGSEDAASGHGVYINNGVSKATATLTNVQVDNNSMAGIYVVTQGNIVLTGISAYANGVTYRTDGAYLNNCSGAGTVTVSNSEFLSNGSAGLNIISLKNVSLNGITANDNLSFGVFIDNRGYNGSSSYLGNGTVSITGKDWNTFNGNAYYGLYIYSNGNVTLANFTANDNLNGVFIENNYVGKTGRVTINQTYTSDLEDYTNTISGNTTNGLEVYSNGAISIDSLNVYDNRGFGTKLDNSNASKPATVDVRDSAFYGNANGLEIRTAGSVNLYSVDSYGNTANGLYIIANIGTGSVTITSSRSGTNGIYNNGDHGILILSAGVVNLRGLDVTGNGSGAFISNTYGNYKSVYISNCDFSGSTSGSGLSVFSSGAIVINGATSSKNNGNGMLLDNSTGNSGQNVKLNNIVASNNTDGSGIEIDSLGMVILQGIIANSNSANGVKIDNCMYDAGTGTCASTSGVRINGNGNEFNNNTADGLVINTAGNIVLTNISASNNSHGLYISNPYASSSTSVKLSNSSSYTNTFDNNAVNGIYIVTPGTITLAGVEANENTGSGLYLQNTSGTNARDITVMNATISNNGGNGLEVYSNGNILLKGVEADGNTLVGILVNNTTGSGNVTIFPVKVGGTGTTTNNNGTQGLSIYTKGNITLTNVTSNSNGTDGAYLYNRDGAGNSIILTNASFDDNKDTGVVFMSSGAIIWSSGSASGTTSGYGATASNEVASNAQAVTISGVAFDNNGIDGLYILSLGPITLRGVSANGNTDNGTSLDNCVMDDETGLCTGTGSILIQDSTFDKNKSLGLFALSFGNITVFNMEADGNGGHGMYLSNSFVNDTANIYIKTGSKTTYSDFSNNGGAGAGIYTNGSVYVANVKVNGNTSYGILINNAGSTDNDSVTLSRIQTTTANGNKSIDVTTKGAIILSYAVDYGDGISLKNSGSGTPQDVTVIRSKVNGVSGTGLDILTAGNVILNSMIATNNTNGVNIDNTLGTNATVTVLNTYSGNIFSNNSQIGLLITSTGDVSLTGIEAEGNGGDGIEVNTSGKLTARNLVLYRNSGNGMNAVASEGAVISRVNSTNNGLTDNGDGIYVEVSSGNGVIISYSAFMGNYGNGIEVKGDSTPSISKTTCIGNDINGSGEKNLQID